ncbi:Hypothetical protein D9617_6g093400 [Elsinoe fawcettii]|nr:Hypothetical protein D9617_6g093400 [Elsinoe fawcettii]
MPRSRQSGAWAQDDDDDEQGFFSGLLTLFKPNKTASIGEHAERPRYVPKHAYRDAIRSFHPPPPVLPRDLRCLDSNFTMDRLAPREMGGLADGQGPPSDPIYSYHGDTSQPVYQGKGKKKLRPAHGSNSNSDYLNAPQNTNMSLAIGRMPVYQNKYAYTTTSGSALHKTVRLSDGLDYPSPAAHARWFMGLHPDHERGPDQRFGPGTTGLNSWDAAVVANGSYGRRGRSSLQRTRSCSDKPHVGSSSTPGIYLAAQRHALVDHDQIYYRHGNVPHFLQKSHSVNNNKSISVRNDSSSSSPSSSSVSSNPYPSSRNSSYQRLHTSGSIGPQHSHKSCSDSSSSHDDSPSSSESCTSTARDTIREDSEGEARAEAEHTVKVQVTLGTEGSARAGLLKGSKAEYALRLDGPNAHAVESASCVEVEAPTSSTSAIAGASPETDATGSTVAQMNIEETVRMSQQAEDHGEAYDSEALEHKRTDSTQLTSDTTQDDRQLSGG